MLVKWNDLKTFKDSLNLFQDSLSTNPLMTAERILLPQKKRQSRQYDLGNSTAALNVAQSRSVKKFFPNVMIAVRCWYCKLWNFLCLSSGIFFHQMVHTNLNVLLTWGNTQSALPNSAATIKLLAKCCGSWWLGASAITTSTSASSQLELQLHSVTTD